MKYVEAMQKAIDLNCKDNLSAKVVRILPKDIDPIVHGDNGWDVEITVKQDNDYDEMINLYGGLAP